MRSPQELADVAWSELAPGHGCATPVPELIRGLYSPDDEAGADAEQELSCDLLADDAPHPATASVVPFLVHAVRNLPARREALLRTLLEVAHLAAPRHPQAGAVRTALRRELPELLPTLSDPDPAVRRTAVRLAALIAGVAGTTAGTTADGAAAGAAVVPLIASYTSDPVPEIRADALTALSLVDPDPASITAREAEALSDGEPAVRVAAALLRLERAQRPFPDDAVEAVADHAGDDTLAEDLFFPPLGTRRQRLTAALCGDPDAALTAAAHWIGQGDRFSHGSRLADQVARSWRDRETEVVDTLATALPQHRDSSSLRALLIDLVHWIPGLPTAPAELRETLLSYTDHRDLDVRRTAVAALARCRDDRALDRATAPGLLALLSFARDPRVLAQLRAALRLADRVYNSEHFHARRVLEALSPELSAQLVPELIDLLGLPFLLVPAANLLGGLGPQADAHPELVPHLDSVIRKPGHLGQCAAPAVALVRLTGGFDARTLPLLRAVLGEPLYAAEALDAVALLGPLAEPLLPQVEKARGPDRQPGVRLAAAAARRRITGDAEPEIPLLAACVRADRPPGHALRLRAVRELAAVGSAPESLHPLLRQFATAERRLVHGQGPLHAAEADEQLRFAARRLVSPPSGSAKYRR